MTVMQLTPAQRRALKWVGNGWQTEPGPGSAVLVNGQRICNIDTMMALSRAGLVQKDEQGSWSATERGKTLTTELRL